MIRKYGRNISKLPRKKREYSGRIFFSVSRIFWVTYDWFVKNQIRILFSQSENNKWLKNRHSKVKKILWPSEYNSLFVFNSSTILSTYLDCLRIWWESPQNVLFSWPTQRLTRLISLLWILTLLVFLRSFDSLFSITRRSTLQPTIPT